MRETSVKTSKRALEDVLRHKNAVRAFIGALILSVIIPVFILFVQFTGSFGTFSGFVKGWLIVAEIIELSMAFCGYYIISHGRYNYSILYACAGCLLTQAVFLAIASYDLRAHGSMLFLIMGGMYLVGVPVMGRSARNIVGLIYGTSAAIIVSVTPGNIRSIFDGIIIAGIVILITNLVHNYIIEYEKANIKLVERTITSEQDPLTGLYNRRGLERKADAIWPYCVRTATLLGVVEIDIDYFKKYNDKFGHPAGDACIKAISGAIKKVAKRSTDITARTGGEEFIVFVQGMSEKEMIDFALNIRREISELQISHAYAGISKYVTVSMGVGIMNPADGGEFDELYEIADRALYLAKENGRNCVACGDRLYGHINKGFKIL